MTIQECDTSVGNALLEIQAAHELLDQLFATPDECDKIVASMPRKRD